MEQGNKKLYTQIVIFIVVFAVAFLGTQYVMKQFKAKAGVETNEPKK
ncbi:hypothetical protein [Flavobacterium phycosphaerae]|nr:hypothetical protein [Flavobacterium phycosphaerae]